MNYSTPRNASMNDDKSFEHEGLRFIEMCRQEYAGNNCVFSAGIIEGHPVEQAYLKWGKDGDDGGLLMLRADELAAIAWVANGAIWGALYNQLQDSNEQSKDEL